MGPEFSSDIGGDGPRKSNLNDDEYDPEQERIIKRKTYNAKRSKSSRKADNLKQNPKRSKTDRKADNLKQHPKRSKTDRKADNLKQNSKRSKTDRKADNLKQNQKRSKAYLKADNSRRKPKSDMSGMEYDTSSPFPPTAEQLTFTGRILENSIAALFAQQSPSPEISYAAIVSEQLMSYTRPIIEFTMHKFEYECCHRLSGDFNFAKAAANKALDSLEKILLINDHYQLMWDFSVYDVCNPPSLQELKLLSTRHPYQPISELLRKDVDTFKKRIHSQIDSIGQYREINSEFQEHSQNDGFFRRYCYPPSEKYSRLENCNILKVVGGRQCLSSNARDFKISNNELIAFQINSEAKFTKVYREGISKCFLMPSEFKDDAMRNFFRLKFEEFIKSSGNFIVEDDDRRGSFLSCGKYSASEEADFSEEHSARLQIKLDYARERGTDVNLEDADVKIQSSSESNHVLIEDDLPPVTDDFFIFKGDGEGMNNSLFKREADRSQKHFLDPREVCLTDWEVRDMAQELLDKLCVTMKELISGKDVESDCKETEVLTSKTLFEQVDLYFRLLRKTNEDSESKQRISQILDNTLVILEDELNQIRDLRCLDNCTEVDKQLFRDRIDAQYNFYVTLGTHSTSLFYEKNQIYENLKSRR